MVRSLQLSRLIPWPGLPAVPGTVTAHQPKLPTVEEPFADAVMCGLSNSRRVPECACRRLPERIGPGPGPAEVDGSRRVVLIFPQSPWDDLA